MCERQESALSDSPSTERTNKGSSNKNNSCGNKKRCHNNKDEQKSLYCLLYGKNSTHNTNDCQNLKKDTKIKQEGQQWQQWQPQQQPQWQEKGYKPNKEEVHILVQFSKQAMKNKANKELNNFENVSVSDDESKWKSGSEWLKSMIILC